MGRAAIDPHAQVDAVDVGSAGAEDDRVANPKHLERHRPARGEGEILMAGGLNRLIALALGDMVEVPPVVLVALDLDLERPLLDLG